MADQDQKNGSDADLSSTGTAAAPPPTRRAAAKSRPRKIAAKSAPRKAAAKSRPRKAAVKFRPRKAPAKSRAGKAAASPSPREATASPASATKRVDPDHGSPVGGTIVKIRARNLIAVKNVKFGENYALYVKPINPGLVEATSPKGRVGTTVDIVVETPRGNLVLEKAFTYRRGE